MKQFKNSVMYEIREWVGNNYSRRLGSKLRHWRRAKKIVERLNAKGRESIAYPLIVKI